jgi:large conductance mechanosensitive channel
VIKFLIVAWVVFLIVKAVNRLMPKKEEAPAAPTGPSDNELLQQILTELRKS